ncbi:MAG: NUDIX hydrolase [Acidimicrobiales bacterium]
MFRSEADPPAERRAILRPSQHRDGDPAPWAGLPADAREQITLGRVKAALARRPAGGLAGRRAREPWRATGRVRPDPWSSAVLVPLFEEDDQARVLLTVRSEQLRNHSGQVAFPGGRVEAGESVVEAALREASEEIALDRRLVEVEAILTPMPTLSSNTVMTPVVASLAARPTVRPSPSEVDRIFDVALADLVSDGAFHEELWVVPGRTGAPGRPDGELPVWFFAVSGETIWGATARTLMELLCTILGVALPAPMAG